MAAHGFQQVSRVAAIHDPRNRGCFSCRLRGKGCSFSSIAPAGSVCTTCTIHNTVCVGSGQNRPLNMRQNHPDLIMYLDALHQWIKGHENRLPGVPPFPGPDNFDFTHPVPQSHSTPHTPQYMTLPAVALQDQPAVLLSPIPSPVNTFFPVEEYYFSPHEPPYLHPSIEVHHFHGTSLSAYYTSGASLHPEPGFIDAPRFQDPGELYSSTQIDHPPFLDFPPTSHLPSSDPSFYSHSESSIYVSAAASHSPTAFSYPPPPGPPPPSSLLDSRGNQIYPHGVPSEYITNTDPSRIRTHQSPILPADSGREEYYQEPSNRQSRQGSSQRTLPPLLAPPKPQRRVPSGPLRAIIRLCSSKHRESDAPGGEEEISSASTSYLSPLPSPSMRTPTPELSPSSSPSPSPVSLITPIPEPNSSIEGLTTSLGNLGFDYRKSHGGE